MGYSTSRCPSFRSRFRTTCQRDRLRQASKDRLVLPFGHSVIVLASMSWKRPFQWEANCRRACGCAKPGSGDQESQKTVEVPQMQFIDKVLDVPMQRQSQPIDKVIDVPEVLQTPVPLVQRITIIDVPAVKQHQVPTIQTDRKTVEVHQSQQTVRVVVVLIVTQQQVQNVQENAKDGRVSTCDALRQNPRCTRRDTGQVPNSADVVVAQAQFIEGWFSFQDGRCLRTVRCSTTSVLQQHDCQSSCVLDNSVSSHMENITPPLLPRATVIVSTLRRHDPADASQSLGPFEVGPPLWYQLPLGMGGDDQLASSTTRKASFSDVFLR